MKLDVIKPHVDKDIFEKLEKKSSSDWAGWMARKPERYGALDKAVKELSLEKLEGEGQMVYELLARKVKEAASAIKAKAMDKSYTPEASKLKIKSVKGHFYPNTKLKKTGKTISDLKEKWEKSKTKRDFDKWASDKISDKDKKTLKKLDVKYMSEHGRKKYHVEFKDGKLRNEKCGKEATGEFIYVLSADGEDLYMAEKKKGELQHSSFFRGKPVQCAGRVELKKGEPVKFTDRSGHYKTTDDMMRNLRKFLTKRLGEKTAKEVVKY